MSELAIHQEICYQNYERKCVVCKSTDNIHVHHIDGDSENNHESNLIPLCHDCHWKVERQCYTDDVDKPIEANHPLIRWLVQRKRSGEPRRIAKGGEYVTIYINDDTRDELRKYKAERGDTYSEAVDRLLEEVGWNDDE